METKSIKQESQLIEKWSESLSERIIEIRFIDKDEMKKAITAHVKAALFDCIKMQVSETGKKLKEAKLHYIEYGGGNNNHIQSEIISLKIKLKEERKFANYLVEENKYAELKKWVVNNHGLSLDDFYKYYKENFEFQA